MHMSSGVSERVNIALIAALVHAAANYLTLHANMPPSPQSVTLDHYSDSNVRPLFGPLFDSDFYRTNIDKPVTA